ncbi:hypothetical protein ATCCBAA256_31760 [Mycobacterium montefiorense]|nr:hypothetical protein ATCCBAA256_31760 [Mycobacterium montefiorense]
MIAGKVNLHVGCFCVIALCTRRRQRIAPEILDVLNVLSVLAQLLNQVVVKQVSFIGQWLVRLQNNHSDAV